jgi:cytoskeletal protein RodZ
LKFLLKLAYISFIINLFYTGVFVIDDQPDAAHLEVFDDGFQLVSRKKPKKESEDPRSRSNSRSKPQKTRSEKLSSGIGRSNTKQQTQPTNRSSSRQIPPQQQPAISTPDKEIKSENQNSTKTVSAASRPTVTFTNSSYFSSSMIKIILLHSFYVQCGSL